MRLIRFSVRGFRSLAAVSGIPVASPTIVAGHNGGGKTAVFDALGYLLDSYTLIEDDRTYLEVSNATSQVQGAARCETTAVEGVFELDPWEREQFDLPVEIRVRRQSRAGGASRWEIWTLVPDDSRLRDLELQNLPILRDLVREFKIELKGSRNKPDLQAALRRYIRENSVNEDWVVAPAALVKRLPRLLRFEGKNSTAEDAVRAALQAKFTAIVNDDHMLGPLKEVEREIQERLKSEAKSLCDHIQVHCPELHGVSVEPDVSLAYSLRSASIRIARRPGESVGLASSGLGSMRRVSLAVWEWTSELLREDESTAKSSLDAQVSDGANGAPPIRTIVVYDEPDTHLDYEQQRKVMKVIRDQCALDGVDVMVATHSMNLIDGVDIEGVVNMRLVDHRTVVERLQDSSHGGIDVHLGKIAASLGLRNSVLLHERCFLAVEGETEQQAFPLLFRLSEGLSLQSAGIALWSCGNNEGALHLAKFLVNHGRSVMLMIDADSRASGNRMFKEDRLLAAFGQDMATIVKLVGEASGKAELEELFPDELWARAANQLWPIEGGWAEADFAPLHSKKFSNQLLEALRASEYGPNGKPDMMFGLVSYLSRPEDIPLELRHAFAQLRQMAS